MGPDCPGGGAVAGRGLQGRGWQGAGRSGLAFCSALPRCCCPRHAHPAVTPRPRDPHPAGRSTAAGHVGFGPGGECVGSVMGAGTLGGPQLCLRRWRVPRPPASTGQAARPSPAARGPAKQRGPRSVRLTREALPRGDTAHLAGRLPGVTGREGFAFLSRGTWRGVTRAAARAGEGRGSDLDPVRDGSDGPRAGQRRVGGGSEAGRRRAVGGSEAGRRQVGGGDRGVRQPVGRKAGRRPGELDLLFCFPRKTGSERENSRERLEGWGWGTVAQGMKAAWRPAASRAAFRAVSRFSPAAWAAAWAGQGLPVLQVTVMMERGASVQREGRGTTRPWPSSLNPPATTHHPPPTHLFFHLSLHPSIHPSFYPSFHPVSLSTHPSIHPFILPCICPSVFPFSHLFHCPGRHDDHLQLGGFMKKV